MPSGTMDTQVQVSFNAKLLVCGGTGSFPTYSGIVSNGALGGTTNNLTEIPLIGNATITLDRSESDVTVRGANGLELTMSAKKIYAIEFEMPYIRNDPKRLALINLDLAGTPVGIVTTDGPINSTLSKGIACDMRIISGPIDENIAEAMKQSFTIKPTLSFTDTNGTLQGLVFVTGATTSILSNSTTGF